MVRVAGETRVGQPPEVVFDFVADERNLYDPQIQHAELLTGEPVGVGSRFRSVGTSFGRPVEMIVEITEHQRSGRLATTTRLSWMDIHSTLTFEPDGSASTRMRWTSELRPRGPLRILAPLLVLFARQQTARIWAGLQDRLDDPRPPTHGPA